MGDEEKKAQAADTREAWLFLSYGRRDAREFTERLARDVRERSGREVWFDREGIGHGALWEVRVERAIRASNAVAAVMTPRAFEEDSICRDEHVFALWEGKRLVPLRADADVRPTLLLCRRNWIDFTEDYDAGLQALLRYLEGDESGLRPPPLAIVAGKKPFDFGTELAEQSWGFVGREWLREDLDRWLAKDRRRACVILAEPGVGKSAIAAWLARTHPAVLGIHFCTSRNTRSLDPFEFVAALAGHLHARLPGFAEEIEKREPERPRKSASDAFRELIVDALAGLPNAAPEPRFVVVDALDEAMLQSGETIVEVLAAQADSLPPWLRIVATSRPESAVRERLRHLNLYELRAESEDNRRDLATYVRERVAEEPFRARFGGGAAALGRRVEALAEGNFLYAREVLNALQDGNFDASDVGALAPGLSSYYGAIFRRLAPDETTWDREYAPLLRVLAVARAPLSFALLRDLTGWGPEALHRRMLRLRSFLRIGGGADRSVSLFHKSLGDWLTNADEAGIVHWCDPKTAHGHLADTFASRWDAGDPLALAHLPAHLAAAGRAREAMSLLLSAAFLDRKLRAWGPQAVVEDYERVLQASEPGGLADVEARRVRSVGDALRLSANALARDPGQLPSQLLGRLLGAEDPAIRTLLDKAARNAKGPWLRPAAPSLTPPGTGLLRTLEGHASEVNAVALDSGGGRAVSASYDRTLKVWDLGTGECLRTLEGHADWVNAVALDSGGGRIVSASGDRTLKVWDLGTGECLRTLEGHAGPVTAVAHDSGGGRAVSASWDKTLKVWDLATGACLRTLEGHANEVTAVALDPGGGRIVSGSWDRTLKVWDLATGECLATFEADATVACVAWAEGGDRIVGGDAGGRVHFLAFEEPRPDRPPPR